MTKTLLAALFVGSALTLPAQACTVTRSDYENLRTGMTYRDVVYEVGCDGEEQMSIGIGASNSVNYMWRGKDLTAMFYELVRLCLPPL